MAQLTALLAAGLLGGKGLAATQPPHDVAGGTDCVRCHIPYGSVNDSAQASGATSAGSSTTSLVDAGKSWTSGTWTGAVVTFKSGDNLGQYRTITGNNATTLSWTAPLSLPLAAGDTYQIGKTTYDDVEAKCRACHSATGAASTMANVGLHVVNGGATVIGCGKCHEPHNVDPNTGRGNGILRLSIRWPTATAPLAYPSGGPNPFIVTTPPYNGICQVRAWLATLATTPWPATSTALPAATPPREIRRAIRLATASSPWLVACRCRCLASTKARIPA